MDDANYGLKEEGSLKVWVTAAKEGEYSDTSKMLRDYFLLDNDVIKEFTLMNETLTPMKEYITSIEEEAHMRYGCPGEELVCSDEFLMIE